MERKKMDNVSSMELPKFYISSAVKYVCKGEKNVRSLDKVRSNHRKSSKA